MREPETMERCFRFALCFRAKIRYQGTTCRARDAASRSTLSGKTSVHLLDRNLKQTYVGIKDWITHSTPEGASQQILPMHSDTSQSISVRIVTVFIICFFAITLALFTAQCFIEYTQIRQRIQNDFDKLQIAYQQRLSQAYQQGNDALVRSMLRGIYNVHAVGGVILESADGSAAIAIGQLPKKAREYVLLEAPLKPEPSFSWPFDGEIGMRAFDLTHVRRKGEVTRLGRVSLYANTSLLVEEFVGTLLFAGLYALVYFLGVSLMLIFLVRRMVARPLGALADEMKNVTKEDPENIVLKAPVQKYSELQTLFASFNFMLLSFISARQALRASSLAIKERNRALSVSEKKYRELFENSIEGMFLVSPLGEILDANPALASLLGYASVQEFKEQARNMRTACFVRPEAFDALVRESKEAFKTCHLDTRFQRKDAAVFWGTLAVRPFWDKESNTLYFRGSLVDITERLLKQEAEKEKEAAKIASKAKGEFLAQMSHEIRTPLNGVIGLTRLALSSGSPEDQRELLEQSLDSAQNLVRLLDEILDFSRIEAGMLELERIPFCLEDIFSFLTNTLGPEVARKRLELVFDFAENLPLQLVGDPLRLQQILMNLAGNAVKFTDKGEIVIRCELLEQQATGLVLEFSVFDTGIGMDEEQQEQIFTAFSQADSSISRKYGGSGLGLVICSRLVEKMGGRMDVRSMPGKGSVFSFTARFDQGETPAGQEDCRARFAGKKALVCDDNASSATAIARLFGRFGMEATVCASGADLVSLLENGHGEKQPEYLLVDWNMPEFEEVQAVRLDKAVAAHGVAPVIMLPAFGPKAVRQRTRDDGIRQLLYKPVTPGSLCKCLRESGEAIRQDGATSGAGEDEDGLRRLTALSGVCEVLLVEDNEVNTKVAKRTLEILGCRVTHAASGPAAVESVQTMRFDIVFMDIQLPGMNGYEAARAIRAIPRFTNLPIVALTAHAFLNDREKSLAAGMNEHLTKPLDPAQLRGVLEQWCRHGCGSPPQDKNAPVMEAGQTMCPLSLPGIDVQDVQKRLLGDWTLLQDSLQAFRREFANFSQVLETTLASGDNTTAAGLVHTLKGAAASISALPLRDIALELELALKHGGEPGEILPRLDRQLTLLLEALETLSEQ